MTERAAVGVLETSLPGLVSRGKVRDLYDLGDRLMIVASDRISAFDVVMAQPVPGKGALLTRLSEFWLKTLPACTPHHLEYVVDGGHCPESHRRHVDVLRDRAMVVRKATVIPIECVVRGYVVGGGWKEYKAGGAISGIRLPPGLRLADRLPEPIFTPSTKAAHGHDEPISFDGACEAVAGAFSGELRDRIGRTFGVDARGEVGAAARRLMEAVRKRSLAIYEQAAKHAVARGILLADTKFEFGLASAGDGVELLLIDEALTPDSSRFWPADAWRPGENPPSFDKQFLRDYLETLDWPKTPPPPAIPAQIIEQTRRRYQEAFERLTAASA